MCEKKTKTLAYVSRRTAGRRILLLFSSDALLSVETTERFLCDFLVRSQTDTENVYNKYFIFLLAF